MRRITIGLIALAFLAASIPVLAQTLTGTIEGVVKDEQGGALPGVSVTLTGKRGINAATTNAAGEYRFGGVDVGTYSVTASLGGFRSKRQDNVTVWSGRVSPANLTLAVGGVAETIEVVAEAPVVDVKSSATDNALSQDMLFNLPIRPTNAATGMLNYIPGINNGSAFGGNSDYGNALSIDGVDTRDPEGGSAWVFFNFDLMEQIQVSGLGAPAEYGSYTGAVVNTITKSGGNQWSGLFDAYYTKASLQGNNATSDITKKNPALADPAQDRKRLDITGQLGGPIIKDKMFFYLSAQRYQVDDDPTGPVTTHTEVSPRLNGKLTYMPTPNDNLQATFQWDNYNQTGRTTWGAFASTDDLTVKQDSPEAVWGLQWRHVFSPKTFLETKYAGWWGYYYLDPKVQTSPVHYDIASGAYSGSSGVRSYYDRTRQQVNAAISHYAEGFGKHDLKFGIEIERSWVRDRTSYLFGIYYQDYIGVAPKGKYMAYDYGYDIEGKNQRESLYAQDSWHVNDRLTINPGVRLDLVRGKSPALDDKTVYDNTNIAPRIGFAYDLTGNGKTVIKGNYGQYYEGMFYSMYFNAVPGTRDFVVYEYDAHGSKCGPLGNCFSEIDRTPYSRPITVDPNMKHPRVDEWTAGFARALGKDMRLEVTGIWREDKNAQKSFYPDARWTPVSLTYTTTADPTLPGTVTGYNWANRSASELNHILTNVDGLQYRDPAGGVLGTVNAYKKYKGLMFVLDKRFTDRWQGRISYVLSETTGTLSNSSYYSVAGANVRFDTPTIGLTNVDGHPVNDRTHELKVFATYQIPKIEVGVNAYWRTLTGRTYTPYYRFTTRQINYPFSSGRSPNLIPAGDRRLGTENNLDLRLEKIFKVSGNNRLAIYADIQNVFNTTTVTAVNTRNPSTSIAGIDEAIVFQAPMALNPPRKCLLGARWSF
jgi:hypothetical protein